MRPGHVGIEQGLAAGEHELRLFAAGYDFQLDAGFPDHPGDEFVAVRGAPAGVGGDATRPLDTAAAHLAGTDTQTRDGARHGRFGEDAPSAETFAETDDTREGVDHAKALIEGLGDQ